MIIEIALISFFLSLLSTFFFQKLFIKKKIIDKINNRSSHSTISTRSGGVSIFLTVFLISIYYYLKGFDLYDYSFLLPLSILLVVGCYDDIYKVDFKLKFIFQIIVAKIILDSGLVIDNLHGLLGINELNRVFAQLLTILIVTAIINAINFIDGLDGLAISIISIFIVSFELFSSHDSPFKYLSIIVLFSFLPLYYFNFKRENKVFLGDSGSLFLGGIVSIYSLYILSDNYLIIPKYDLNKIIFIFSILSYPIIDITRVIIIRLYKNKSPFEADRNHIHHYLLKVFKTHFKSTLIISLLSLVLIFLIQIIKSLI
ncbi:MAG: MraY family glycosyltransferase [Flammeovirgaceae bacterium]